MDTKFVAAIYLINMGQYDLAAEYIRKAIKSLDGEGCEEKIIMYTCVLGELFAKMGDVAMAREEFDKVIRYCNVTNSLSEQKEIALGYLKKFAADEKKQNEKRKKAAAAEEKPIYTNLMPNTTQTTYFLQ